MISKRAQPIAQIKKNEIKKMTQDFLTQMKTIIQDTTKSSVDKTRMLEGLVTQLNLEVDKRVDEAAGQQTVTMQPVDDSEKKDSLEGGVGDDVPYEKMNKKQLEMGQKVEMEHTDNSETAKEIAGDHLAEQLEGGKDKEEQDYYTELKKIDPHDEADDKPAFWRRNLDYGTTQ